MSVKVGRDGMATHADGVRTVANTEDACLIVLLPVDRSACTWALSGDVGC